MAGLQTHRPFSTAQRKLVAQILAQSFSEATTHFPSRAVHSPNSTQFWDALQSALVAATQDENVAEHRPL